MKNVSEKYYEKKIDILLAKAQIVAQSTSIYDTITFGKDVKRLIEEAEETLSEMEKYIQWKNNLVPLLGHGESHKLKTE